MRLLTMLGKELRSVRANPAYNVLTLGAPLVFVCVFVFMLGGDVTSPVTAHPGPDESRFVAILGSYRAEGNAPYFAVSPAQAGPPTGEEPDRIVVEEEPATSGGEVSGRIIHYVNDVNTNMTKNYRNRLTGAISAWAADALQGRAIGVIEHPDRVRDIPWAAAFGVGTLAFGVLFSGLLFGILSISEEWEMHTISAFQIAPISPTWVVSAKLIAACIKAAVAGVLLLGVVWALTGEAPMNWGRLVLAVGFGYLVTASVGILVGLVSRTILSSFLFSLVVALVAWVGGGGLGPLFVFGPWAVRAAAINPGAHIVDVARWAFWGGRYDPAYGLTALAVMAASSTAVVIVVGAWRLRCRTLR